MTTTVLPVSVENGGSSSFTAKDAPTLPHVEMNQLPLSLLLRNLTVFAVKEISQFMKINSHTGPKNSSEKKIDLLNMILYLRNQFLKLYVLVKWARTLKENNFNTLIDLLNWFRNTNMQVNNCTMALKQILGTMAGAKLPNPDLVTSLEVMMLGRPNLPTHGYILNGSGSSQLKIPPKLMLKKLRELNTCLSVRISLMDVPSTLSNYTIRDGRIIFTVRDEFELQLSTINQSSPLFFVNIKLLFNEALPLNMARLEKHLNDLLLKSSTPLQSAYQFLHKYTLTLQMYMIHMELNSLETEGKYSGGHMVHNYDSKKQIITIKYWLQSKIANKCKCVIGMDRNTESIILQWQNPDVNKETVSTRYHNLLNNIESIMDEITFNHTQMIRSDLLLTETFEDDDEDTTSTSLLFQIPTTCATASQIQLKMDQVSGIFFFNNPSSLLLSYSRQINQSSSTTELVTVLGRLKLDKVVSILRHMLDKTGWICSDIIKLKEPITAPTETTFAKDMFVKLKDWPSNWFLILTVISSTNTCIVEKAIGKIISVKGIWELKYIDRNNVISSKLDSMTYPKMMALQKSILNRIVNHMILDSLNELNIKNKICSPSSVTSLPSYIIGRENEQKSYVDNVTIIVLGLESFLQGCKALNTILESSMLLKIDYSKMDIELYGKFKTNNQMIRCQCDDLLIHFLNEDPLSFYMSENFGNLNDIMEYLSKFRKKLAQLIALRNVMDNLHGNFQSGDFHVVELRPNEIRFKYLPLKDSTDTEDCVIKIVGNQENVEQLEVQLSEHNPQFMIQKFLNEKDHLPHDFIFNYLQFTLPLFRASSEIDPSSNTSIHLFMHSLQEFHVLYRNSSLGVELSLLVQLKTLLRTRHKDSSLYYLKFLHDYTQQPTHPLSPIIRELSKNLFSLPRPSQDHQLLPSPSSQGWEKISCIRLGTSLACSDDQILPLLLKIHSVISQL